MLKGSRAPLLLYMYSCQWEWPLAHREGGGGSAGALNGDGLRSFFKTDVKLEPCSGIYTHL
eukprot:jgi/Botrbrau1/12854/Bobra.0045s0023.1